MNERVELPQVPSWLAALPFLFARPGSRSDDLIGSLALGAASAALAADPNRRDSRSRVCFLLAELAGQYARRTGDRGGWVPVGRAQLARAAEISLPKIKRVLGFLLLSGVIELGDQGIRVLDWRRLCKLAAYDRSWLTLAEDEGEDDDAFPDVTIAATPRPVIEVTAAGDPVSFV